MKIDKTLVQKQQETKPEQTVSWTEKTLSYSSKLRNPINHKKKVEEKKLELEENKNYGRTFGCESRRRCLLYMFDP